MNVAPQRTIPLLLSQLMCCGSLLVKCFQPFLCDLVLPFYNENKTFGLPEMAEKEISECGVLTMSVGESRG